MLAGMDLTVHVHIRHWGMALLCPWGRTLDLRAGERTFSGFLVSPKALGQAWPIHEGPQSTVSWGGCLGRAVPEDCQ